MPDNFNAKQWEQKLLQLILKASGNIRFIYEQAITEIALKASQIDLNGQPFYIKDYPALMDKINAVIEKMHPSIYGIVVNSIVESWSLSNQKNNFIVDKRLAGNVPFSKAEVLYDPNHEALLQFIKRKKNGLNLSERIWNTLENYPTEMELSLAASISEGKPAARMASEIKKFLKEPDKLFRRVRDKEGKLKLSKAAKEYHPGQGVYRSSFQNALRVTASETNISYRSADHERWKNLDFVTGIEVHTSNSHTETDECDFLSGLYPPDYVFLGNHPRCKCYATTRQLSEEDYVKYVEEPLLRGEKPTVPDELKVQDIPDRAKQWYLDNKERILGWKNKMYNETENPEYVGKLLKRH